MLKMNVSGHHAPIGHNRPRAPLKSAMSLLLEGLLWVGLLGALAAVTVAWWLGLNLVGRAW